MLYDEIKEGMAVRIVVPTPRNCGHGVVKAKEIQTVAGKRKEVIFVDDDRRGRRLCAPSVLQEIK
jgi:5S rRNA maturation endonuclease (ribonuclease M5)